MGFRVKDIFAVCMYKYCTLLFVVTAEESVYLCVPGQRTLITLRFVKRFVHLGVEISEFSIYI